MFDVLALGPFAKELGGDTHSRLCLVHSLEGNGIFPLGSVAACPTHTTPSVLVSVEWTDKTP